MCKENQFGIGYNLAGFRTLVPPQDLFPHERLVQARQEEGIFSLMRTHYPRVRKQNG